MGITNIMNLPFALSDKDMKRMTSPEADKLWRDWELFKKTAFYANIISHAGAKAEGLLWCCFYKGWEIGNGRHY